MLKRRRVLQLGLGVAPLMLLNDRLFASERLRILLIHGRGQGERDPQIIEKEWKEAFERGFESINLSLPGKVTIEFPFYGSRLDEFTNQFGLPLASDISARGDKLQDEFLKFQAEIANELVSKTGITDEQINSEYGNNSRPRGPLNWEWVQSIIRALDKHAPGLSQQALETFLRDVFLYITRSNVRNAIDGIVKAKLTKEPTIVIAHSLGSVVAYNILKSDSSLNVPLLVTLGSPLGIRTIRNKFRPIKHPSSVTAWYNGYDERDVVALIPLDKSNFDVEPSIINDGDLKNQTKNRHGIVGYLDKPSVAKRISQLTSN